MNSRHLIAFLFLIAAPAPDFAADASSDTRIHELGRQWLFANDGVGLSIGVYDAGQRRFYNFGATRLDGDKEPTPATIYEIGAIGKTMTGQLLARAIVEGRANADDEAAKYLDEPYPNLVNGGEKVRLKHLANMTSQLADNIPDLTQVRAVPGEPIEATHMRVIEEYTREEFLQQLHRVAPRRPPGSPPAYSNVASMLLGVVLEKIYGQPFPDLLASEIERPLHMGSGTHPDVKLLAKGYTKEGKELPPLDAKTTYASAGLRYSTDDLLRYATWQLVERDASVKLAHRQTWSTTDGSQGVGFYWIVTDSPHGRRLNYSGGTYGFAGVCDLYPQAGVAVVLLSNKAAEGAQDSLRALSAKIVDLVRPISPTRADVQPADR